jgi:predicted ribosomally synthesized peptide with SipW-like signal peptide
MKKLWKYGFLLLAVAIMAFGMLGTGAWFSDTVTSTGNSLTAATLRLNVNGNRSSSQTYVLSNIAPGAWDLGGQAILKNIGTIPGHLWYEIVNVSPADGPLGALVYPSFQANSDGGPWPRFGGTQVINAAVGTHVDVMDLAPGASIPLVVYFTWPSTANDNSAQGASLTFDVVWHLDQIH